MMDTKLLYEKLDKLDSYMIIRIARNIGINENSLSQSYVNDHRGDAINKLLDIVKNRSKNNPQILDKFVKEINDQLKDCKLPPIKIESEHKPGTINSPSGKSSHKSFEQELAELLLSLNYRERQRNFVDLIQSHKGGAFLVRADKKYVQDWLVCRLAKCTNDFFNAKKIIIDININIRVDFNTFWEEFNEQLKDSLNRERLNPEQLIENLTELCKTKSVIIVISSLSSLQNEKLKELHDFSLKLINKFQSLPKYYSSQLVLLLVEENNYTGLDNFCSDIQGNISSPPKYIQDMKALKEISHCDVERFLSNASPNFFPECSEDSKKLIFDKIEKLELQPDKVLKDICNMLPPKEMTIENVKTYWKIP